MGGVEELSKREIDYLLTVFKGVKERGYARHREIVEELGVSKPTVSLMVKKLEEKGLVEPAGKGVRLTEKGAGTVAEILRRHCVIETAFVSLGVSLEDACRLSWETVPILPDNAVSRIWESLGMPSKCPCGFKFPSSSKGEQVEEYEVCFPKGKLRARP